MEVKDNFLDDVHLIQLDELINDPDFAWYLQKEQVPGANDGHWFRHIIYHSDEPRSNLYDPVCGIFRDYLKYISLCRITVNLLLRQETPSISDYHIDYGNAPIHMNKPNNQNVTTAIFYLNTNNGSTEFKNGDIIDSVRNRIIMFPANTSHRAIGQTDVLERIVLNFNFIL